jgi:MFS family permease
VAVSMIGIGLAIDVYEVLWMTTMQENIPADKLSRVASWDGLGAFALGPVGLIVVGPVAAAIGTERALIGGGALVAISTLAALATPSVRRLPSRSGSVRDKDLEIFSPERTLPDS